MTGSQKNRDLGPVVDLGAGTGILSALALDAGAPQVTAVEYFSELANFATLALEPYGERARVLNARSYDVQLKEPPRTLLTETIGLLGPEENIVELVYDFARRHPSIRSIIPARLRVLAQWASLPQLEQEVEEYLAPIVSFAGRTPKNSTLRNYAALAASEHLFTRDHSDERCDWLSEPIELADYRLGLDSDSSFQKRLVPPTYGAVPCNALHLYFEATLAEECVLSSHIEAPLTHWQHSFLWRPEERKNAALEITYKPGFPNVLFSWKRN